MTSNVRSVFLDTADIALRAVEDPIVGASWEGGSALVGYSVGGLAAHLCRAISTPLSYLDSEDGIGDPEALVDAPHYFRIALSDHDPVDSGAHVAVRQRSDDMAAAGWLSVVDATRSVLQRLELRLDLEQESRALEVLGGMPMRLDEYLKTRIVELVIHGDDLAVSCGGVSTEFSNEAWAISRVVVAQVAALRNTDRDLVMSLSRQERTDRVQAF